MSNEQHLFTIINGEAGIGKTFRELKKVAEDSTIKAVVFVQSHRQAGNVKEQLEAFGLEEGVDFIIWIGLARKEGEEYVGLCEVYDFDPLITKLIDKNVSAGIVCRVCDYHCKKSDGEKRSKTCPFKAQFKSPPRIVIATYPYLQTVYPQTIGHDYFILDDIMDYYLDLRNRDEIAEYIQTMEGKDLETWMQEFRKQPKKRRRAILNALNIQAVEAILESHRTDTPIPKEILLDANVLYGWANNWDIVKYSKSLKLPLLEYALDLCDIRDTENEIIFSQNIDVELENEIRAESNKGKLKKERLPRLSKKRKLQPYEMVWIDAYSNLPYIEYLCSLHPNVSLSWENIGIENTDKPVTKTVYRLGIHANIHRNTKHPKFIEETKKKIVAAVQYLLPDKPLSEVKIIIATHKTELPQYTEWGKTIFKEVYGVNYGNSKGDNNAIDADLIFLIGLYSLPPKTLERQYLFKMKKKPTSLEYDFDPERGMIYKDPDFYNFSRFTNEYEVYQASNRIRCLLYDKKVVFYTIVPEWVKKHYRVKQLYANKMKDGYSINTSKGTDTIFFDSCLPDTYQNIKDKFMENYGISEAQARRRIDRILDFGDGSGYKISMIHTDRVDDRGRLSRLIEKSVYLDYDNLIEPSPISYSELVN